MPIYDVFSNRHRPRPEKLTYAELPKALRAACIKIIEEVMADEDPLRGAIDRILEREHPAPSFVDYERRRRLSVGYDVPSFAESCIANGDFFEAMDAIEVSARMMNEFLRKRYQEKGTSSIDGALNEINGRFHQYGVGFQFSLETNRFTRIDAEHMHAEVVAPAMRLLTEKGFEGPAQEFDRAQQAYRDGRGKDAVTEAVRAVESTAKAIMDVRGWAYEKGDTIKPLLDRLFENGLIPVELQSYFGGLRSALETGLPPIGNAYARHGQGATVKPIGDHMVTLGLHLAASTIRFLVEVHLARSESADA